MEKLSVLKFSNINKVRILWNNYYRMNLTMIQPDNQGFTELLDSTRSWFEHDLNSQSDLPFSWSLLAFGEGVNEPVSVVCSMLTSADQCAQCSSSYWYIGNVHNSFFHFNPVPPDGILIQWIQTDWQSQCFLLDSHVLTKLRRKLDHRIREIPRL
jgi:hypothetical protein